MRMDIFLLWMHMLVFAGESELSWLWLTKKRDFVSEQSVYCSLSFSIRIIFTRPGTPLSLSFCTHTISVRQFLEKLQKKIVAERTTTTMTTTRRKAEDAAIIIQNLFFYVDTWVSKISLAPAHQLTRWLWFLSQETKSFILCATILYSNLLKLSYALYLYIIYFNFTCIVASHHENNYYSHKPKKTFVQICILNEKLV